MFGRHGGGPAPQIIRAMENLKLALRLRRAQSPLAVEQVADREPLRRSRQKLGEELIGAAGEPPNHCNMINCPSRHLRTPLAFGLGSLLCCEAMVCRLPQSAADCPPDFHSSHHRALQIAVCPIVARCSQR